MDYLGTNPRTTPTDPSTDHPQNKIKKSFHLLLVQLIDHSCQRNFARLYAGLRWVNVTDLGSVLDASYFNADHYIFAIFIAVALHERPGSLRICDFLPFAILFIFEIVKPGTSSRTRGSKLRENRPNKMAKEMHSKQHKFRDFPEISQSFIYTYSHGKEKVAMWNVNDIT